MHVTNCQSDDVSFSIQHVKIRHKQHQVIVFCIQLLYAATLPNSVLLGNKLICYNRYGICLTNSGVEMVKIQAAATKC